ncbi:hypothetical protein [Niabella soli]|uniref:Lipoprotein n=1 Tax=Niabella soli DSM 19437 TaxID=929713 RepID=W0F5P1_9BACT|nr:hypothetical protein [Niabella soli]AHF17143.1 hypothetical protein NIASO_02415 [Niabella soli DSM 19437]
MKQLLIYAVGLPLLTGVISGCSKPAAETPATSKIAWNRPVVYDTPFTVDIDANGEADFRLVVVLVVQDGLPRKQFKVTTVKLSRVGCDTSRTPLLWEKTAIPPSMESTGFKWTEGGVVLLEQIEGNVSYWQGPLKDKQSAAVAIRLIKNGKPYYGHLYFSGGGETLLLDKSVVAANPYVTFSVE